MERKEKKNTKVSRKKGEREKKGTVKDRKQRGKKQKQQQQQQRQQKHEVKKGRGGGGVRKINEVKRNRNEVKVDPQQRKKPNTARNLRYALSLACCKERVTQNDFEQVKD